MEGTDVLLVEDYDLVAMAIEDLLSLGGYRVSRARGTAEGWMMFRALGPRAVVTDRQMPDGDGLELARRIKAAAPATPVVMFSGAPPAEAREVCDIVLSKPCDFRSLVPALGKLGVRPQGRQPDGDGRGSGPLGDGRGSSERKVRVERLADGEPLRPR